MVNIYEWSFFINIVFNNRNSIYIFSYSAEIFPNVLECVKMPNYATATLWFYYWNTVCLPYCRGHPPVILSKHTHKQIKGHLILHMGKHYL